MLSEDDDQGEDVPIPGIHTMGYVDFILEVGNDKKIMKGIKCYLLVKSPVLRKGIIKGKNQFVHKDIDPKAFEAFLQYLHMNKFSCCNSKELRVLLQLASEYEIADLTKKCQSYAIETLSIDTCVDMQLFGSMFDLPELQKVAFDFMTSCAARLIEHPSFLRIQSYTLARLIGGNDFVVDELKLFMAVRQWVIEECKRNKYPPERKEFFDRISSGLFNQIRFSLIKPDDFEKFIEPLGVLNANDLQEIKLRHATPMSQWCTLPPGRFVHRLRVKNQIFVIPLYQGSESLPELQMIPQSTVIDYARFSTTVDMFLTGIDLFGPNVETRPFLKQAISQYNVTYQLLCSQDYWEHPAVKVTISGSTDGIFLKFPNSLQICKEKTYTLTVQIQGYVNQRSVKPLGTSVIVLNENGDLATFVFSDRDKNETKKWDWTTTGQIVRGIIRSLKCKLYL